MKKRENIGICIKNPLKILNFSVLLQQQRYIVAISYLFYIQNGLNLYDFLFFQSIFYFTGLLAEIPAGYIADIFSRKKVLIFSYMLFTLRIIMLIILPNYWTILAGEVLYGLSKAFYRGASDSYIYEYLKCSGVPDKMTNKYGRFNFFMSCGSAISCLIGAWLYKYIGFTVLLSIELYCNSTAILLLLFLPNLPQKRRFASLNRHIKILFNTIIETIKNTDLSIYMIYGGILSGITSVFVWNFQPLMKSFAIPVYVFGIVYFVNHIIRALCSFGAYKFLQKSSLEKTGFITWFVYIISFMLMFKLLDYNNKIVCIAVLLFICIAIGIQMIFSIGNVARIHRLISRNSRATISSVYFMLTGLFSGVFLMLFKSLSASHSIKTALLIFLVFCLLLIFIVNKMCVKESDSV